VTWAACLPALSLFCRFSFWVGLKPQCLVVISVGAKDPSSGLSPWSLYAFARLYLFFVFSCIRCVRVGSHLLVDFGQTLVLGSLFYKLFRLYVVLCSVYIIADFVFHSILFGPANGHCNCGPFDGLNENYE